MNLQDLLGAAARAEGKAAKARATAEAEQQKELEARQQRELEWARRVLDDYSSEAWVAEERRAVDAAKEALAASNWVKAIASAYAARELYISAASEAAGAATRLGEPEVFIPAWRERNLLGFVQEAVAKAQGVIVADAFDQRQQARDEFIDGDNVGE